MKFIKPATERATAKELYWAAGFLEGEGYFAVSRVQCGQSFDSVDNLARLRRLFGGSIRQLNRRTVPAHYKVMYTWDVTGARARGVQLTLFKLLSVRRQYQILDAFGYDPQTYFQGGCRNDAECL